MTDIESPLFKEELHYTDGTGTPRYNGNISSISWKAGEEQTTRGYRFTYDGLNRMKMAEYGEGEQLASNPNRFNEEVTAYDKTGNILGIRRMGQTGAQEYGLVDNLTLNYNGNQLTKVTDNAAGSAYGNGFEFKDGTDKETEYAYDTNGNLTQDLNRNIKDIQYNFLNLPKRMEFGDGSTTEYLYDAEGRKLRTVHKADGKTTTTDYAGNLIYENGKPIRLVTEYGYVSLPDGMYHYYLQDHQGNNRVVADRNGKVEEVNHYYPFGGMFANNGNVQPYKYNGKELDTRKGLNWYDYGARNYDPTIGRWHVQDLMQEKYYSTSQYAYCINNPIRFVDPNGKEIVVGTWFGRALAWLGFDNYEAKVNAQLNELKSISPILKQSIEKMENSQAVVSIRALPSTMDNKGNQTIKMKKGNSLIYYNPENHYTNTGKKRPPIIGLAHELGHAEDIMNNNVIRFNPQKAQKENPKDVESGNKNEKHAIDNENIVRKHYKLELRDYEYFKQKK